MLWTNKENQLIIYDVEINEEQIKKILDNIVLKYNEVVAENEISKRKFIQENSDKLSRDFIKVFDKDELEIRDNGLHYSTLITLLTKILEKDNNALVKLYKYSNSEYANDYIEYIDEVLENISLIKIYNEKFENLYELLKVLIKYFNRYLPECLENIKEARVPYQFIKKTDNNDKNYQKLKK